MSSTSSALVIGVGNRFASDDAAGLLAARAFSGRAPEGVDVLEHEGEPTALVEMWAGRRLVVIVDAMAGSGAPGTLRWFDATTAPLPSAFSGASTHAFSLPQAILWQGLADFILVSEEAILQAMAWMLERAHTLAEAAGAAPLAAAYQLRTQLQGQKVDLVCSGGNASLEQLRRALNSEQ